MQRKVLFMISSMRGGGSERQTLLLLQHLNRNRFAPQLYLTHRSGDLLSQVPDDVPVHSFQDANVGDGLYFPGRALRQQVSHLRDLIAKEAIDVIYDRTFHMTMIAGPAANSVGVPRVSTIVSLPQLALPLVEKRFVSIKRRRLAKAYRQSKHVVAVSEQAAQSARTYYGLAADHVQVIHNPIDIHSVRQSAKAFHVDRDTSPTFVCVGRMSVEKGHADLIEALAITESQWPVDQPPIKLWMIGDGPLKSELMTQAKQRLQKHRIEFLGQRDDVASLIHASDALILPSRFEGMPNVVLEAMALRTPVIATRAGGTIELERTEPTAWWADPQNPTALAASVMRFLHDREEAARRADAAARLVESHHDVRNTIHQIESLLS